MDHKKNKAEMMSILLPLSELFGKTVSKAVWAIYYETLKDIPNERIRAAANKAATTLKFFPKPVEIRELAGMGEPGGNLELMAGMAWGLVRERISNGSPYDSVNFGPLVNGVLESMGGWVYLTELSRDELVKWRSKDFVKLYISRARGGIGGPPELPGIVANENSFMGYGSEFIPDPIDYTKRLTGVKLAALMGPSEQKALKGGKE